MRKQDHIDLSLNQRLDKNQDSRFFYEPLLGRHAKKNDHWPISFLGKDLEFPLWISSMTGGTESARRINHNLAMACRDFKLGMGLGSCRPYLETEERRIDFELRHILGEDRPFFANMGIAQIEQALRLDNRDSIDRMVDKLKCDGLIIHINPLQELLQREGDCFELSPLQTLEKFLRTKSYPVILKEVGQGMGPASLKSCYELGVDAIEFAAYGGTNFSEIENRRQEEKYKQDFQGFIHQGHDLTEMIEFAKPLDQSFSQAPFWILSGGIKDALDAYYYIRLSRKPVLYGMAGKLLEYARGSYEDLYAFLEHHFKELISARQFLQIQETGQRARQVSDG